MLRIEVNKEEIKIEDGAGNTFFIASIPDKETEIILVDINLFKETNNG